MSPTDAVFLLGESREHPMHVGGLSLYEPPEGAGLEFVREFYDSLVAQQDFQPTFLKRPATFLGGFANLGWSYDKDLDIDYHVRRSALPSPGRVRDLLELTSLLHSSLLDRHRPLWEAYVIEGLKDGRFAIYTKMHHSLIDGVSALKLMQRAQNPWYEVRLIEGRQNQIRLMFKHFGRLVEKLKRVRIGFLELGSLQPGKFRHLTPAEVARFRKLLSMPSLKEEER